MAHKEILVCDELTCADQIDVEELAPGSEPSPWVSVSMPVKDVQLFNPMTGQREWVRSYKSYHFSRARCLALWACGLADDLAEQAQAAEQARRDAVGAQEWTSPIPAMKAMRAARLAALRTADEQTKHDRLRAWMEGGNGAA